MRHGRVRRIRASGAMALSFLWTHARTTERGDSRIAGRAKSSCGQSCYRCSELLRLHCRRVVGDYFVSARLRRPATCVTKTLVALVVWLEWWLVALHTGDTPFAVEKIWFFGWVLRVFRPQYAWRPASTHMLTDPWASIFAVSHRAGFSTRTMAHCGNVPLTQESPGSLSQELRPCLTLTS